MRLKRIYFRDDTQNSNNRCQQIDPTDQKLQLSDTTENPEYEVPDCIFDSWLWSNQMASPSCLQAYFPDDQVLPP